MIKNIKILPYLYLQKIIYYLHNNKSLSSFKKPFTGFDIPMLTSQDRHRSKSIKRIRMKSPFDMGHKGTTEEQTHGKNLLKKSKQSNSDSTDSERKVVTKSGQNRESLEKMMKKITSTEQFKNKIMISSSEFTKLKQKLEIHTKSSQSSTGPSFKQPQQKKLKIKILNGLSKQTSDTSDKNNTIRDSEGSSDSEQIELLKVENEYFKKIYDEAMDELSKLKNKLKQEKKVHEVQKQIYQNQINKLKRIVDSDREQVSHIICDQDNRYIIVVESIGKTSTQDCTLGIDSDCEESIGDLMLESKLCP